MELDTIEDIDYCRDMKFKDRAVGDPCLPRKYVNAYSVASAFGGPEEGGWWYNEGEPIASIPIHTKKQEGEAKKLLREILPEKIGEPRTTMGGVDIDIVVQERFAEPYPKRKPRYE